MARHAGVSPASVSRVLNRVEPTSERLRAIVEKAVRELGYIPKGTHAQPAAKTVVVFTPDLLNPYFNETAVGIEDRARGRGLVSVMVNVAQSGLAPSEVQGWLQTLSVSGCVIFGGVLSDEALVSFAQKVPCPVVAINQALDHPALKTITLDYVKATYQVMQHLLQLGHREVVFLGGSAESASSRGKVTGIENAAREAGLTLSEGWNLPGAPTIEWGFQAMTTILSRPAASRPTAAVCACDLVALGALHAARSAGLNVPRDISVVGFDDIEMACHANPPLTTVSPPKYEMGTHAVELLLRSDNGSNGIKNYVMLESPLIVRESTAVRRAHPGE